MITGLSIKCYTSYIYLYKYTFKSTVEKQHCTFGISANLEKKAKKERLLQCIYEKVVKVFYQ